MDTDDSYNRCFVMWRDRDQIVAAVYDVSCDEPVAVWFEEQRCRPLDWWTWCDPIVDREDESETDIGRIQGFFLPVSTASEEVKHALLQVRDAANVINRDGHLLINLRQIRDPEIPEAGFRAQVYITSIGKAFIVIAGWDDMEAGFDIVTVGAPTVSPRETGTSD